MIDFVLLRKAKRLNFKGIFRRKQTHVSRRFVELNSKHHPVSELELPFFSVAFCARKFHQTCLSSEAAKVMARHVVTSRESRQCPFAVSIFSPEFRASIQQIRQVEVATTNLESHFAAI